MSSKKIIKTTLESELKKKFGQRYFANNCPNLELGSIFVKRRKEGRPYKLNEGTNMDVLGTIPEKLDRKTPKNLANQMRQCFLEENMKMTDLTNIDEVVFVDNLTFGFLEIQITGIKKEKSHPCQVDA